jgi:linoleoyl-CoA desaturase
MAVPRPEKIQFRGSQKDEFLTDVRKRVDAYFLKTGSSKNANMILHLKGLVLFSSLFLFWSTLMFGWAPSIPRPFIWMLFGINQGLLAMNVGHDALHGSYSKSPLINLILGYFSYDLVGLSSYVWKQTHNQGHHTYTNIEGHDPDINKPGILRLSPHAPFYKAHRFQHLYIWLLYALVGINWVLYSDYYNVWQTRKAITLKDLVPFLTFKAINLIMIIFLPLFFSPMEWWQVLMGYLCLQFAGGLTVSIIFQLAHIVENVEFPLPDEEGVIPANWGVHEMRTTSNFATRSTWVTHLFGGLNFQIEHHLMPKISHAHYRQISPIVKQTALDYGLPYHEQPSLTAAVASHARILKQFGCSNPSRLNIENIP